MQLHPLCSLFPRMEGAEFAAFVQDIRTNGLREPIVVHDNFILDGGNRHRACLEAGIEPVFKQYEGDNIVSFVLSANMHRRHLTVGQQAAIVASAQDWAKAQTVGNQASNQKCNLAPLNSVEDRAALSNASRRTQLMADKVAKADPELAKQVGRGETTLPKAVEQITGKRPGAKPQHDYDPNDPAQQLRETRDALNASNDQVRYLSAVVKSARSDDTTAEIVKLHERIQGLEGRLSQEVAAKNEAIKQAKYYKGILDRIEKKLGVHRTDDIFMAIEQRNR